MTAKKISLILLIELNKHLRNTDFDSEEEAELVLLHLIVPCKLFASIFRTVDLFIESCESVYCSDSSWLEHPLFIELVKSAFLHHEFSNSKLGKYLLRSLNDTLSFKSTIEYSIRFISKHLGTYKRLENEEFKIPADQL